MFSLLNVLVGHVASNLYLVLRFKLKLLGGPPLPKIALSPVDELDGLHSLEPGDGGVDLPGHHVAAVEQADGHVLARSRVALHHLRQFQI